MLIQTGHIQIQVIFDENSPLTADRRCDTANVVIGLTFWQEKAVMLRSYNPPQILQLIRSAILTRQKITHIYTTIINSAH